MKVKKVDLLTALEKVKVGLSDKAIIDQTDHFVFGERYVSTYNDKIAISYPFSLGFPVAVKASEFHSLMRKIIADEIDLQIENDQMKIVAGKTKAQIVIALDILCPPMLIDEDKGWKSLPKDFAEGVGFCCFSADTNMLLQQLTCLWITKGFIFSADHWRATKFCMEGEVEKEFMLPAESAKKLSAYAPVQYLLEEAWVHFKNKEGVIFSSRIVAGEYPQVIWSLFEVVGDKITIPKGLRESVDRVSAFATKHEEKLITLSVVGGKMTCKGKGALGWIEDELLVRSKDFEVNASPEALMDILSKTSEMFLGEKLFFKGPKFQHVISIK
jgi:DNA polymerase III sliding clamp (beta) subunit (PCNA family)